MPIQLSALVHICHEVNHLTLNTVIGFSNEVVLLHFLLLGVLPNYNLSLVCPTDISPAEVDVCQQYSDCNDVRKICCSGVCVHGVLSDQPCTALINKLTTLTPAAGTYIPQCSADGSFSPIQCWNFTNTCWCVHTQNGWPISDAVLSGEILQCEGEILCAM